MSVRPVSRSHLKSLLAPLLLILTLSLSAVGFNLVAAPQALAAPGPSEIVSTLAQRIKAAKSAEPLVDYVHWPTMYNQMSATERTVLRANSPETLKEEFRKLLRNPSKYMEGMMSAQVASAPAEQQDIMKAMVSQALTQLKKEEERMSEKIAGSEYSVGKEQVNGSDATVELISTYQGESSTDIINLKLVDGSWYLLGPSFGKDVGGAGGNSGAVPAPRAPSSKP